MQHFRSGRSLQKHTTVHSSVHNQLNHQRHLVSRENFKKSRDVALNRLVSAFGRLKLAAPSQTLGRVILLMVPNGEFIVLCIRFL